MPNARIPQFTSPTRLDRLKLRQARKDVGMTIVDLAVKSGLSHTQINLWELGRSRPRMVEFCQLVDALGVEPGSLFSRVEPDGEAK